MKSRNAVLATTLVAASFAMAAAPAKAEFFSPMDFYFRGEVGGAMIAQDRGHWRGADPGIPRIIYDLDTGNGLFGGVGFGANMMPGVRGDVSINVLSRMNADGTWIATEDPVGAAGPHAQQDAAVSSVAVFANLFVEPLAIANIESPIQPFVTAGAGIAFNHMYDWTRSQLVAPLPARPVRTFDGNTQARLAWTVGGGVTASLGELFGTGRPVLLDLSYRYMDLGNVKGGSTPTDPGNPPREPFNFDLTTHTVAIGLRIPFSSGR